METEDLKKFSSEFIKSLVPNYVEFILEKFDNFIDYSKIVTEMPRASHHFQNLSKYHSHAMEDKKYKKFYRKGVKESEKK